MMGSSLRLFCGFVFTFIFVSANCVEGYDWPQYRGPHSNGKSTHKLNGSGELKVHWKVPTPLGFSSFAVAHGKAVTLVARDEKEVCLALNAETGKEAWAKTLGSTDYGSGGGNAGAQGNKGGDGPRSTPTIDSGRVYVYDAHLVLYCFNLDDGELIWSRNIATEFDGRNIKWKNATSPIIDEKNVYVAGGGAGQSFLAFDKNSGKLNWKTGDEKLTHATPVPTSIHDRKQLVFFMQSGLVSIDPKDGKEIWRADYEFNVSSAASPVIKNDLVYCSAGYGVGGGLFRVSNSSDVAEVWSKPNRLINHWSTPVESEGYLYGLYKFKRYGKAPLQCVSVDSGEVLWAKDGFGQGNCIIVGDKIAVLSDFGELTIVEASPEQYRELSRNKVLSGKCWSTPAFSNGKFFIRSTTEGACVSIE